MRASIYGRALIVGGGVCGPVAAMALQRAGIEAVVYEAQPPAAAAGGSYPPVPSHAPAALRAIDAAGRVLRAAFPTGRRVMLSGTGGGLGGVAIGSPRDHGVVSRTIKRARLHQAL